MAVIKDPVLFCNVYPDASASARVTLRLPFGMPELEAFDLTCEGLSIFTSDLTASLSAFFPVIKLSDCVLKVIAVLQAIPDAFPPGNPSALIQKISELADCVILLGEFTGLLPTPFCKFIYDLCNVYIKILNCIISLTQITVDNQQSIDVLNASGDVELQQMASCLETQNEALKLSLGVKFDSMKLVLVLLNAIVQALPPVAAIIGPIDPGSNSFTPEAVLELLDVVTAVRDVAATCAGT